ncbi:hypothetical protein FRC17_000888 [Serendipita sp. 399]|nr:hypothetical protein FRC17_000888 [Serendipita sp. 399]
MPVTFKVASHNANPTRRSQSSYPSEEQLVDLLWSSDGPEEAHYCQEVLQSSYVADPWFHAGPNGFIDTVVEAYSAHHHLIIRPDDICVNANAEDLRSKFVAHEGQKQLEVWTSGTRYTVDFGWMASEMGQKIKENILDETLHDWVIPNFTTTTPNDIVICSVLLMSTLQKYFTYLFGIDCGLPSVTLLGERSDYLSILLRLDRFQEFSKEPALFANFLRPILKEFVNAFDYQMGENDLPNPSFWSKICHRIDGGSGPTFLCGWITAFCVWDLDGKWQGGDKWMINEPVASSQNRWDRVPLFWENMRYPLINMECIPRGFCQVPVTLLDNNQKFDCEMIAGHVGMHISAATETNPNIKDTFQPAMEWFIFIKRNSSEPSRPLERPAGLYEIQQRQKKEQRDQQRRGQTHGPKLGKVESKGRETKSSTGRNWRGILSKVISPLQRVQSIKGKGKSPV